MEKSISHQPAVANERLVLFSGTLTVSAGVNKFSSPKRVNARLLPGLKVVILLSGRLQIKLGSQPEQIISGPATLVIRNPDEDVARDQVFAPDIPIRYALVQMDQTVAGSKLISALDRIGASRSRDACVSATVLSCPASRTVQSLAMQIMNCPVKGAERELYLAGKALQLSALAVASCVSTREARATQLSSREIEAIRQAHDLLVAEFRNPLGLEHLAQQVGLNVQKLNRGFRQLFGDTAYGFLQEYRLEQAYKMLAAGEMSVSEVAYHVGYGAAHFATIFRERFGVSPSKLR